jgi:hypothetical protein
MVIQPCSESINRSGSQKRFSRFAARILLYVVPALVLIILHTGCSPGKIVIYPNYKRINQQNIYFYNDSIKVIQVYDNRNLPDRYIGTIRRQFPPKQITLETKVPLNSYIKNTLNKIIQNNPNTEFYLPVIVYIDTLNVWEKRTFNADYLYSFCYLRFVYATSLDSAKIISVVGESHYRGRIGAYTIDILLNKVLLKCSEDFLRQLKNSKNCFYARNPDFGDNKIGTDCTAVSFNKKPEMTFAGPPPAVYRGKVKNQNQTSRFGLGTNFFRGYKIRVGTKIGFSYFTHRISGKTEFGKGVMIMYYNTGREHNIHSIEYYALGLPFNYNSYFSKFLDGIYFGLGFSFQGGVKRIRFLSYYQAFYEKEIQFFFGFNLDEYVGFALSKILFIEIGPSVALFINDKDHFTDLGMKATLSFGIP